MVEARAAGVLRHCRVALVALISCGCATQPRTVPTTTGSALGNPAEVLTLARQREDRVQTLRTRFSSVFQRGNDVRRAQGVLVVKKPERFRLRLVSPFGFTVLDFLSADGSTRLALPLEHKLLKDDEIAREAPFSAADLRPAFLRGDAAFPGTCVADEREGAVQVDCRDASGALLRQLRLDRSNAAVLEEISYANGQPRLMTRYSDFRQVDDQPLPFAIELHYPGQDVVLRITVDRYEINPVLGDELFAAGT